MSQKTIRTTVRAGDRIPFSGTIVDGFAMVDESAQTGVSTPAMLDSTGDRNTALADTLVVEGWLTIESPASEAKPAVAPKTEAKPAAVPKPVVKPAATPKAEVSVNTAVAVLLAVAFIMLVSLFAYFTSCKEQTVKAAWTTQSVLLTKSPIYSQ